MEVKIRAFHAVNDLRSCQKFVKGHMEVLRRYGITMITSANIEWFVNPHVVVLVAESPDGQEMYGGMRIHVNGGNFDLPIENAVGKLDPKIYAMVEDFSLRGTGEFCGMWNSKEVSGKGISYILTSAATAMINQLPLNSMFVLCAEYTVHMVERVGFRILTEIGNQGTFYYPKLDLIATALIKIKDDFSTANPDEINFIRNLIDQPNQQCEVYPVGKTQPLNIEFQLELPPLPVKLLNIA